MRKSKKTVECMNINQCGLVKIIKDIVKRIKLVLKSEEEKLFYTSKTREKIDSK